MKKYSKRRDVDTMVRMVNKLKNPAEGTVANLKSIEQMQADNAKSSGYIIPEISSNISAYEPDQVKDVKKKDKSLTDEQRTTLEGAIEAGDKKAIRKSGADGKYKRAAKQDLKAKQKQDIDKASETLKLTGETTRLNPTAKKNDTIVARIFGKRKARKEEEARQQVAAALDNNLQGVSVSGVEDPERDSEGYYVGKYPISTEYQRQNLIYEDENPELTKSDESEIEFGRGFDGEGIDKYDEDLKISDSGYEYMEKTINPDFKVAANALLAEKRAAALKDLGREKPMYTGSRGPRQIR